MLRMALLSLGVPTIAVVTVVPVAAASREWAVVALFATAAVIYGMIAAVAHRFIAHPTDQSAPTQLAGVAAAWLTIGAGCSLVTWIAVHGPGGTPGASELRDPVSAVFESVSGISTTGLTMLVDPSQVEPWLQWWRSVLQWLGAIGVVVFALALAEPSGDHDSLIDAEWGDQPGATALETARRLTIVMAILACSCGIGLVLSGEPIWRSVNHAMSTAATGGFAVTQDSAASSGPAAQIVIAVTLVLSALSFGTIWDTATNTGTPLMRRTQVRWGLIFVGLGVAGSLAVGLGYAPAGSLVFNSISASTTGGFAVGDSFVSVGALGTIAMVSMFVGGAAGSTGGGVKVARIVWMLKAARRWLPGRAEIADERPYLWDGDRVDVETSRYRIMGAAAIISTTLAMIVLASIVLAVANRTTDLGDVVFDAISAASGVGLSRGVSGPDANGATKAALIVLMLAGRVEMTAFIVLLVRPFMSVVNR